MSAFDVDNPLAIDLWDREVQHAAERRPWFWVSPPPRPWHMRALDRLARVGWPIAALLRRLGWKPASAVPVATAFGIQRSTFNTAHMATYEVDTWSPRQATWEINLGPGAFRVEVVASAPITEAQALTAIEVRHGWARGEGPYRLVRLDDATLVRVYDLPAEVTP